MITCRMTNRHGDRCTAEALDPDAKAVICQRHAAEVMHLISDQMARAGLTLDLTKLGAG